MNDQVLLEKKPLVDSCLKKSPRPLSSFSFVSIFAWCDFFDFELIMIDDCLCIFAHDTHGCFLYLPPLGRSFDDSTISKVFEHMAPDGARKAINRIENIPGNLLSSFGLDRYNQYSRPAEYVYRIDDLMALKGSAYKSQRHDCNNFVARHGRHDFDSYSDIDFDSCMGLFDRWAKNRARSNSDSVYQSMLQENRLVHARLLKFWQALGLIVRVLKVDGNMVGYTFGFALDENTFCVYAEIADLEFQGSAAYMFKRFCSEAALAGFNRINTMDDFAMPSVARTKQAYHPSELIVSYTVSIKKGKD